MKTAGDSPGATSEPQGAFPRVGAARWLPWLALPLAIALAIALSRQADVPGLLHDDAVYVAMANSIAAGEGPIDGHLPAGARTSRFPPLHSLLLAATRPLLGVAPDGVAGARAWLALNGVLLGIACFAFLQWQLRWRRVAPMRALATAALAFTLPHLLGVALHWMSEPLFLAELCTALWLHERALARPTRGRLAAAGLVGGLLPATRTIGAGVVAALALHGWLARRAAAREATRAIAVWLACAALPWLAALAWSASAADAASRSPLFGPPYGELLLRHLGDAPWIAWVNLVRFGDWIAFALVPGWAMADGSSLPLALLRLLPAALLGAATIAALVRARRERRAPPVALDVATGCGAMLLPWPFPDLRFVLPLAPLLAHAIGSLLESAARRFHAAPRVASAIAAALLLALAAWNAPLAWRFLPAASPEAPRATQRSAEAGGAALDRGHAAFFGGWMPIAPFDELAAELARRRAASPADELVVASSIDSLVALRCGVRGVSAWANDLPFEESYAARGDMFARLFFSRLPPPAALDAMAARESDVLAEYRRLGVRLLVVPRVADLGPPTTNALVDRMLARDRASPSPRFAPAWRSGDGALELWSFDAAKR